MKISRCSPAHLSSCRGALRFTGTRTQPGTLKRLLEYNWPGNVRELKNTIDRAVIMAEGDEITPRDLPDENYRGIPKSAITDEGDARDGLRCRSPPIFARTAGSLNAATSAAVSSTRRAT